MTNESNDPFGEFDARMARAAPERQNESETRNNANSGTTHMGLHVGVELVAGVIGGALLGYGVDYLLGSYPFGLLSLLLLGSAAGMLNAYRYIQRLQAEETTDLNDRSGSA